MPPADPPHLPHSKRADRCYAAPYWRLAGARNKTYNFLEHVGTQALLYDLELLRSAMGLERLSFYGASYGTGVASSYASTFPERTGRVVLDGNLFPFPNTVSMGLVWTSAVSQVIEHMLNNCRVKSAVCALQSPFRSFEAVLDAARRGELRSPKTADGSRIALNNGLIVGYMHDVAEERGCGWKKAVLTLALLNASDAAHREVGVVQVLDRLCKVGQNITWRRYSSCIDGILVGEDDDAIMGTATLAMDNAGRLNVDSGVGMWRAERKLYGEHILGHSIGYVSSMGTWQVQPKPVAPIGSVDVAPLVVGNLYDQATSYILSQHMAASFPRSSLITYQGLGHCLDQPTDPLNLDPSGTGECTKLVKSYLRTGALPPKGHTCAMDVPIPVPTVEEVAAAAAVGGAK